jgi:hypothetical protein
MLPQCRRQVCDRGHDLNVAYVTIASFAETEGSSLLRDRVRRQPGGFEGLRPLRVILDPGDLVRHFNYLRDGGGQEIDQG